MSGIGRPEPFEGGRRIQLLWGAAGEVYDDCSEEDVHATDWLIDEAAADQFIAAANAFRMQKMGKRDMLRA
jgi:hypothetical protein